MTRNLKHAKEVCKAALPSRTISIADETFMRKSCG
jgi:hypothetical protein